MIARRWLDSSLIGCVRLLFDTITGTLRMGQTLCLCLVNVSSYRYYYADRTHTPNRMVISERSPGPGSVPHNPAVIDWTAAHQWIMCRA